MSSPSCGTWLTSKPLQRPVARHGAVDWGEVMPVSRADRRPVRVPPARRLTQRLLPSPKTCRCGDHPQPRNRQLPLTNVFDPRRCLGPCSWRRCAQFLLACPWCGDDRFGNGPGERTYRFRAGRKRIPLASLLQRLNTRCSPARAGHRATGPVQRHVEAPPAAGVRLEGAVAGEVPAESCPHAQGTQSLLEGRFLWRLVSFVAKSEFAFEIHRRTSPRPVEVAMPGLVLMP